MAKYRKKPVVIEALKWTDENPRDMWSEVNTHNLL